MSLVRGGSSSAAKGTIFSWGLQSGALTSDEMVTIFTDVPTGMYKFRLCTGVSNSTVSRIEVFTGITKRESPFAVRGVTGESGGLIFEFIAPFQGTTRIKATSNRFICTSVDMYKIGEV